MLADTSSRLAMPLAAVYVSIPLATWRVAGTRRSSRTSNPGRGRGGLVGRQIRLGVDQDLSNRESERGTVSTPWVREADAVRPFPGSTSDLDTGRRFRR